MKFTEKKLGGLIVPLLAIAYALFALREQYTGDYMELTTDYALLLAVPVLVLAGIVLLGELFPEKWDAAILRKIRSYLSIQPEPAGDVAPKPEPSPSKILPGSYFRTAALTGCALLLVFSIETIGYHITFFAFVTLVLIGMGIRAPITILVVSLATILVVHFAFVELLDLPLPTGVLEDFLEGTE
ncbi:MAG: tripartite tricarboxylate transporter TctB family protein [Candidatus Methylomirabilales bacterium]